MKKLILQEKYDLLKKFVEEVSTADIRYELLADYKDKAWHILADITE